MNYKNKIYVDMDRVLVDFDNQFETTFNIGPIREAEKKYGRPYIEKIIENSGEDFWENMRWMPEGKSLWNFIKNNFRYVYILSSPGPYTEAVKGKIKWLDKEIGKDKYIAFFEKDKDKYSFADRILVDDYDKNINNWKSAGGIGILYKNYDSTVNELKSYI